MAILLGGAATGVVLKIRHDDQIKAQKVAAAQEKKREADAAAAEAAAASAKQSADEDKRAERRLVVTALEESIVKDAKEKVKTDLLDGPILSASCTPLGGGSTDDLTALTGTFECIAVNKNNADGTASGYRFSATVNWSDSSYSWHLG